MTKLNLNAKLARAIPALALALAAGSAGANPVYWTDWTGADTNPGSGFSGNGTITTTTTSIGVNYTNAAGVAFYQANGGTDYWVPRTPVGDSPYTSDRVDNPPTGTDIIALRYAGSQTLTFSQTVANPVLAFVSLNGNGYAFLNQDFDVLSYGCGKWGCGSVTKEVVDLGNGNREYRLIGIGEPHGAIRFTGGFDTLSWRSMSSEYWNGFTVGVQGSAAEIPVEVPVPASWLLLLAGSAGLLAAKRYRKAD